MSHVITSRYRDTDSRWFRHCIAAQVRRIVRGVPAKPVALLAALILSIAVGRAQTPITYDTVARDTLGETLWTIDLSGPMTPSLDGTKFLVVNNADAMFYVVDVATGAHRKITSAPRVADLTAYVVSTDFQRLAVSTAYRNELLEFVATLDVIDLSTDNRSRIAEAVPIGHLGAVSSKFKRAVYGDALLNLETGDTVSVFSFANWSTCWFDDAHGLLYRSRNVGVDEYDAVTGRFIRSHGPFWNAEATVARRAPGSPWLYVVTTRMAEGQSPYVVAIHTETKEQRYFDAFAGSRQSFVRFTAETIQFMTLDDSRLIISGNAGVRYPVWMFDAEEAKATALCDASFRIFGEHLGLPTLVSATSRSCIHNEPKIGDETPWVIRHRRLVPRSSVSTSGDTGVVIPSWFRQWPDRVSVVVPVGTADEVVVVSVGGAEVLRLGRERLQATPVDITTTSLASGAYVCRLRMGEKWLSQTFVVTR